MKLKKKSHIIYHDSFSIVEEMTDEMAGKFAKSLCELMKTGKISSKDTAIKLALYAFKKQFDRDMIAYKKRAERNRENGKKGGRPQKKPKNANKTQKNPVGFSGTQSNPENPVGFFGTQSNPENPVGFFGTQSNPNEPKKADTVTVTGTGTGTGTYKTTPSKKRKDSPTSTVDSTSRDFPASQPQPPAIDQDAPPPPDDSYFCQDDTDSYIDPDTGEEIPFPGWAS